MFLAVNWTYTGLFNLRRLVADEDFHSLVRSQGSESTRLGSDLESRFWLSYRPYEAKNGEREWFIGPALTLLHSQDDRISGSARTAAVEMLCWLASQPISGCGREFTLGWRQIGILRIPAAHSMRRFVATSVSALPNSFAFISKGGIS